MSGIVIALLILGFIADVAIIAWSTIQLKRIFKWMRLRLECCNKSHNRKE